MLGHWLSFAVCLLVGHEEPMWECGPRGLRWRCPRCCRVSESGAVRARRAA